MASFYFPKNVVINEIPVIIYPCIGVEKLLSRTKPDCIESHIKQLYEKNVNLLKKGNYHIIILWDNEGDIMSDVWIFDKLESWQSGPLVDVKIFRNFEVENSIGVSAGDGLVMLGYEEMHRRSKTKFDEYINGNRPELPEGITPKEEFYT